VRLLLLNTDPQGAHPRHLMKPSLGIGVLIAVLISIAVGLLGLLDLKGTVSMALLLSGLWIVLGAFLIEGSKDRAFYAGWGIIIAGLSLSYFIPIVDALAVIILAIVGLIVVTTYYARAPKVGTMPSSTPTPAVTS
jgi:hypothetical protein